MSDEVDHAEQDTKAADDVRLQRPLGEEEFKAKLEMTKAFCDTAKSYVQISSAGLALPLFFINAILGTAHTQNGLGSVPWTLLTSWSLLLVSIACGLVYQWLAMRRLWDQYHMGHRTRENMHEPGYRITPGIMQTGAINLSWVWLGMVFGFFYGALFLVIFAGRVIAYGH
jgi:hypothetical protein